MDVSNMKNIIILKSLPSNLVDEAIVFLKENKKVKRYQYIVKNYEEEGKNLKQNIDINHADYIKKEAEYIISQYISKLETKSPKWKNNMEKLEKKYKTSIKINFILTFATIISLVLSIIN